MTAVVQLPIGRYALRVAASDATAFDVAPDKAGGGEHYDTNEEGSSDAIKSLRNDGNQEHSRQASEDDHRHRMGEPTPVPSVLPTVAHPLRVPDAVAAVQHAERQLWAGRPSSRFPSVTADSQGTQNWKRKATALGIAGLVLWMVLANLTPLRDSSLGMAFVWIVTAAFLVGGTVLLVPRRP